MDFLELKLGDNHFVFVSPDDVYKFELKSRGGNNNDEVYLFLKQEDKTITVDGPRAAKLVTWLRERSEPAY